MLRICVCVSGGGTNLGAIFDAMNKGTIKDAKVVRVISSKPGVFALERAKAQGVESVVVYPKDFPVREDFHNALLNACDSCEPDLIVLAGFLVNLPSQMVTKYKNRIVNIHPSLIPSFCGKGYYGLHVHEAVLNRGVKVTGATVHFVDEGIDTGRILAQKAVSVEDNDTPEILQIRVMQQAEWIILPEVISKIAAGEIAIGE